MRPRMTKKRKVLKYIREHMVTYPSDVASEFGIDLKETVEICKKLEEQGLVKCGENSLEYRAA